MYIGTTPKLEFIFSEDFDMTGLVQVWITFKSPRTETKQYEKTYYITDPNVTVDATNHKILLDLSQAQTLEMQGLNHVDCQIRFLFSNNMAPVTNIVTIPVERVLKGGVITNE